MGSMTALTAALALVLVAVTVVVPVLANRRRLRDTARMAEREAEVEWWTQQLLSTRPYSRSSTPMQSPARLPDVAKSTGYEPTRIAGMSLPVAAAVAGLVINP